MDGPKALLGALSRDFWAYATMMLDARAKGALEDACRKAGVRPPARMAPAGDIGPAPLLALIQTAFKARGASFVHHVGFYCGQGAARLFEANIPDPHDGVARLAAAMGEACPSYSVKASAKAGGATEISLIGAEPLPSSVVCFASGFTKGACTRLNEGARPAIRERSAAGGRVWVATVEWKGEAAGAAPRVRDAGRIRRR